MIRTETVMLTVIPATAYRQKLPAGGSGIVILRKGSSQPGIASISKSSGEAIPTRNTPADLYPQEAFREAIALTVGLPYKKRRAPSAAAALPKAPEAAKDPAWEPVVDSEDYRKIVDAYTDKKGRISYLLLNKDMIRFAHTSSKVRAMIAEKASVEEICLYVTGTKFRHITGNRQLSDDQVLKTVELLDEVSPKGVLSEFIEELRQQLRKSDK